MTAECRMRCLNQKSNTHMHAPLLRAHPWPIRWSTTLFSSNMKSCLALSKEEKSVFVFFKYSLLLTKTFSCIAKPWLLIHMKKKHTFSFPLHPGIWISMHTWRDNLSTSSLICRSWYWEWEALMQSSKVGRLQSNKCGMINLYDQHGIWACQTSICLTVHIIGQHNIRWCCWWWWLVMTASFILMQNTEKKTANMHSKPGRYKANVCWVNV